jgi:large subunit ribosomal protein L25
MAEITLAAETGRPIGTRASKRLRAQGKVPGVVYGMGREPLPVTVDWKELRAALTTDAGLNALLNLDVGGDQRLSIVKEMQRDPIHGTVRHVDFLLIEANVEISVDVPIHLEGEATKVINAQGTVDQTLFQLTVNAKPGDIPDSITIDVSGLEIGDAVRVGDLSLPSGVSTDVDPEEAVVVAQVSAAAIEAEHIAEADAELAHEQAEESEHEAEAAEGGESGGDEAASTEGDEGGGKE